MSFSLRSVAGIVLASIVLLALTAGGLTYARAAAEDGLPIIPGAAGFGITTVAGSGRNLTPPATSIFKVTHLKPSGAGSLQECIRGVGPRTCIFEVAGVLDLTEDETFGGSIEIANPYLTIAGQTAPSPGITIKGKQIRIYAHDVLIQHIRIRAGDDPRGKIAPIIRHAIEIIAKSGVAGGKPRNIVIDHCSISWGIDETVSVKASAEDITISNSIVAEGLSNSLHPKGQHSMGIMASSNRTTLARNIIANTNGRTPLDTSAESVIVNNLLFNTGESGITLETIERKTSVVGNIRLRGPDSKSGYAVYLFPQPDGSRVYAADNVCSDFVNDEWPCVRWKPEQIPDIRAVRADSPPVWNSNLIALPAGEVVTFTKQNAGARPQDRDEVDLRIVAAIDTGVGSIPDCVTGDPIYYPVGVLGEATATTATFSVEYCFPDRFVGEQIEIVSGPASGQVRDITAHTCDKAAVVTVAPPFATRPSKDAAFRIINSCAKNAGGWPKVVSTSHKLVLPDNPYQLDSSGYTSLELFLHRMSMSLQMNDRSEKQSKTGFFEVVPPKAAP